MKILFPKKSREIIFKKIHEKGEPKDFFYGCLENKEFDIYNSIIDTRPSKEEFNIPLHNKIFNRFFRCNFSNIFLTMREYSTPSARSNNFIQVKAST